MRPQRSRAAATISASACLAGDVGREGHALAARLLDHGDGLLGGAEIVVDREHLGALLREAQHGGAAVAHALAGRLAGADHDGDLVFETHGNLWARASGE